MATATMDEKHRERRHWSPDTKAKILVEWLGSSKKAEEVAREHDMNVNMLYAWKQLMVDNAHRVFTTKKDASDQTIVVREDTGTLKQLRSELEKCKNAVVSLVEENLQLRHRGS